VLGLILNLSARYPDWNIMRFSTLSSGTCLDNALTLFYPFYVHLHFYHWQINVSRNFLKKPLPYWKNVNSCLKLFLYTDGKMRFQIVKSIDNTQHVTITIFWCTDKNHSFSLKWLETVIVLLLLLLLLLLIIKFIGSDRSHLTVYLC
jgi:hypothetical protein